MNTRKRKQFKKDRKLLVLIINKNKKENREIYKKNNPILNCIICISFRYGRVDMKRSAPNEKIVKKKA
jgi:hypothetical protein